MSWPRYPKQKIENTQPYPPRFVILPDDALDHICTFVCTSSATNLLATNKQFSNYADLQRRQHFIFPPGFNFYAWTHSEKNICSVRVEECTDVQLTGFTCRWLENLTTVDLSGAVITDGAMQVLNNANLTALTSLDLSDCDEIEVVNWPPSVFSGLSSLTRLNFSCCTKIQSCG
jgi:hypothetical protein